MTDPVEPGVITDLVSGSEGLIALVFVVGCFVYWYLADLWES